MKKPKIKKDPEKHVRIAMTELMLDIRLTTKPKKKKGAIVEHARNLKKKIIINMAGVL
jgi:hypothetical protein